MENKEFVKNYLHFSKINLKAKNHAGQPASLTVNVYKNQVTVTVYTGIKENPSNGILSIPMSLANFYTLKDEAHELLKKGEANTKLIYDVQGVKFKNDGGKVTPYTDSIGKIIFGIDKEGLAYIACDQHKQDNIKFTYVNENYNNFIRSDGTPLTRGEASIREAAGWFTMLGAMLPIIMDKYYEHPPARKPFNGKNAGGNNNNSGSSLSDYDY